MDLWCRGSTQSAPGSSQSVPGSTQSVPGSTLSVPGITQSVPRSAPSVPSSTQSVPGSTHSVFGGRSQYQVIHSQYQVVHSQYQAVHNQYLVVHSQYQIVHNQYLVVAVENTNPKRNVAFRLLDLEFKTLVVCCLSCPPRTVGGACWGWKSYRFRSGCSGAMVWTYFCSSMSVAAEQYDSNRFAHSARPIPDKRRDAKS